MRATSLVPSDPGVMVTTMSAEPNSPPQVGLAPPHSLEAEQSVLGAILLSEKSALRPRHRGGPAAGRLLPRPPSASSTRRCSRSTTRPSRSTADRHRASAVAGQPRGRGRRGGDRWAHRRRPRGRQPPPLRPDRPRPRAAAAAADQDLRDPVVGPQPRGAAARHRRERRAGDPRGRPRRPHQGLPRASAKSCTTEIEKLAGAVQGRQVADRHTARASPTSTRSPAASSPAT